MRTVKIESGVKNPNHLGRGILNGQAEFVTFHQEDDYDDDQVSTVDDVRLHATRRKEK